MSESILEINNLSYSYGDNKNALNEINIKINEGEKIAVVGSNGAGKSTFFLNINGVLKPDHGEIYYRKTKITKKNINFLRKNVGIVFQDADNQIIASSVLGEISFGPMNLKLPKEEVLKRVNEAIDYMEIDEFRNRPPHYLSGGEKKKVTIADIIAMKPEIIIFDEPTASLDPVNREVFYKVLHKLNSEKKTTIVSTHDVDFVYKWADRVVVFSNGEIIADDNPVNIFKNKEILQNANLKQPMMLQVIETLVENNIVKNKNCYPRDVTELNQVIQNEK